MDEIYQHWLHLGEGEFVDSMNGQDDHFYTSYVLKGEGQVRSSPSTRTAGDCQVPQTSNIWAALLAQLNFVVSADADGRVWRGNWPQCCHANTGATDHPRLRLYRGQWFEGPTVRC